MIRHNNFGWLLDVTCSILNSHQFPRISIKIVKLLRITRESNECVLEIHGKEEEEKQPDFSEGLNSGCCV